MTTSSTPRLAKIPTTETKTKSDDATGRYFVYIAKCADSTLYTGYTTDPERRIREHNVGKGARYTRPRRPVKLCYLEEVHSLPEALRLERRIKELKKREKLLLCRDYRKREKPS
jgi:putative endonuclease